MYYFYYNNCKILNLLIDSKHKKLEKNFKYQLSLKKVIYLDIIYLIFLT